MPRKILQRKPKSNLVDLEVARRAREVADARTQRFMRAHLPTQKQIDFAMKLNRFYHMLARGPRI